jgi:hypothetical protein
MNLTLYVAYNCHQFAQVKEWIKANTTIAVKNVDLAEGTPPIPTFIFPVLFQGDGLKAYGEDIIPVLKRLLELT